MRPFILVLIPALFASSATLSPAGTLPERCRLLPVKGNCKAMIEAAYFDRKSGRCVSYYYDGCGAVRPFESLEECRSICEPETYPTPPELAQRPELKRDPVEFDPRYRKIFQGIEAEVEQAVANDPRKGSMGFVHIRWEVKKRILKQKYNIDWLSPAEMNPQVLFD